MPQITINDTLTIKVRIPVPVIIIVEVAHNNKCTCS